MLLTTHKCVTFTIRSLVFMPDYGDNIPPSLPLLLLSIWVKDLQRAQEPRDQALLVAVAWVRDCLG